MLISPLNIMPLGSKSASILEERYFTYFNFSNLTFVTGDTVALDGAFSIITKFSMTNSNSFNMVLGNNTTGTPYLAIRVGIVAMRLDDNTQVVQAVGTTNDGLFHEMRIDRDALGNGEIFMDNVSKGTFVNAATLTINTIGKYNSNLNFDGVLADLKVVKDGVTIYDMPLSETYDGGSTVVINNGTGANGVASNLTNADTEIFYKSGLDWLGVELVTNGDFDTDTNWTKQTGWTISGGLARCTGSAGTTYLTSDSTGAVIGLIYQIKVDVILNDGVGFNTIYFGTTDVVQNLNLPVGSYTYIHENAVDDKLRFTGRLNENFHIDNASVKRILEAP